MGPRSQASGHDQRILPNLETSIRILRNLKSFQSNPPKPSPLTIYIHPPLYNIQKLWEAKTASREAKIASREANIYYIAFREAKTASREAKIASREAVLASREANIYYIASQEAKTASRRLIYTI